MIAADRWVDEWIEGTRSEIVRFRTEGRRAEYEDTWGAAWDSGGCSWMSETVAQWTGWQENGGCYVRPSDGVHIAHCWNNLPDGRILDVTADQFHEGDTPDGIRVTAGNDPRYDPSCDCDTSL